MDSKLSKLPKDVLIKLLLTIQEDMEKEFIEREWDTYTCDNCRKTYSVKRGWFEGSWGPTCRECAKILGYKKPWKG